MRRRSRGWIVLVVALSGGALVAQSVTPLAQRATAEVAEAWPRVGIDVTVLDKDDAPVKSLDVSQLSILSNGKPVTDSKLIPANGAPESVCLLVDMSGSTFADRDAVQTVLLKFIQGLPDGDELCGIDFSYTAYVDLPLTTDRKKMTTWLSYLKPSGGTALYDALIATTELMSHARFRSRAIVLISDGGENGSVHGEELVRESFHKAGAPVLYALEMKGAGGSANGKRLLRLTTEAGGLEFPIKRQGDQNAAVERLIETMAGRYRLEFTDANAALDGTERVLDVQLRQDLMKQKMVLVAARGYDAPLQ
jgi:Ca-activated chloride channel family protein